jgi:hypothetical protein
LNSSTGSHDSFAFNLTNQPGPDLGSGLRRFHIFIRPIIKNWSITQNKNFTGIKNVLKKYFFLFRF